MVNMWIVVRDTAECEDAVDIQTFPTKEKAIELYEKWKIELKEWVDDTGFTGDEALYIAKITDALLPATVTNKEGTKWWMVWDEFKGGIINE